MEQRVFQWLLAELRSLEFAQKLLELHQIHQGSRQRKAWELHQMQVLTALQRQVLTHQKHLHRRHHRHQSHCFQKLVLIGPQRLQQTERQKLV